MKKNLILLIILLTFNNLYSAGKIDADSPKELWNFVPDSDTEFYGDFDQYMYDNEHLFVWYTKYDSGPVEIGKIQINEKDGNIFEKNILVNKRDIPSKNINRVVVTDIGDHLLRGYYTMFGKKIHNLEVVDKETKEKVFDIDMEKIESGEYFLNKKDGILVLNTQKTQNVLKREISGYEISTGNKLYQFQYTSVYSANYSNSRYLEGIYKPDIFYDEERSQILLFHRDRSIAAIDMKTGEEQFFFEGAAGKEGFYFFKHEDPAKKIIITDDPVQYKIIDFSSGHIETNIAFDNFKSFKNVEIERKNNYCYLTCLNTKKAETLLTCLDEVENQVIYQKEIATSFYVKPIFSNDELVFFDEMNLYSIDAQTGESKWTIPINNIKKVIKNNDNLLVLTAGKKTKLVTDYLAYAGISLLDHSNGKEIWKFQPDNFISNIWKEGEDTVYLTTRTKIVGLNIQSGQVFNEIDLGISKKTGEITGSVFINHRNEMLLLHNNGLTLYDMESKSKKFDIPLSKDFEMIETQTIGDYLFLTLIQFAKNNPFAGKIPMSIYKTSVNLNTGKFDWSLRIGKNYYSGISILTAYLYYYGSPIPGLNWIRKEYYEQNKLVLARTDSDKEINKLYCYSMFDENNLPSKTDIDDMKWFIGLRGKEKTPSSFRSNNRILSLYYYRIWE
ncbi:MAG: PQQ-binding-like beta-propeller repeat protein [Spirochaetes bacterium]|nr:PQQ-binding-like beta-propeller repeat protein [Spirochaetota bacterium]